MVWDKTKPQGSTKIRNLGNVITPNWDAIESADDTFMPRAVNFADRDEVGGIPSDPTVLSDAVKLYSKQNTAGKPQLYAIDPDSVKTLLTGGSLTAAATGKLVLPNGLTLIWGTGNATTAWVTKNFALTGFSAANFHVSGNASGSTATVGFELLSKTQYKVKASSGTPTYLYFAIGN